MGGKRCSSRRKREEQIQFYLRKKFANKQLLRHQTSLKTLLTTFYNKHLKGWKIKVKLKASEKDAKIISGVELESLLIALNSAGKLRRGEEIYLLL